MAILIGHYKEEVFKHNVGPAGPTAKKPVRGPRAAGAPVAPPRAGPLSARPTPRAGLRGSGSQRVQVTPYYTPGKLSTTVLNNKRGAVTTFITRIPVKSSKGIAGGQLTIRVRDGRGAVTRWENGNSLTPGQLVHVRVIGGGGQRTPRVVLSRVLGSSARALSSPTRTTNPKITGSRAIKLIEVFDVFVGRQPRKPGRTK